MNPTLNRETHLVLVAAVIFVTTALDDYYFVSAMDRYASDWTNLWWMGDAAGCVLCWVFLILAVAERKSVRWSTACIMAAVTSYIFVGDLFADLTENYMFFQYVVLDVCATMMVFCTVAYATGHPRNVTRMIILLVVNLGADLMLWITYRYIFCQFDVSKTILLESIPQIMYILSAISYLVRPGIRDISPSGELKIRLSRVESNLVVGKDAYMPMSDAVRMLGMTDVGWRHYDSGPVERSCTATIIGPTKRRWTVTVRKWRGEGFTRATVTPGQKTNGSWGITFDICKYCFRNEEGKAFVRIYGRDGMFVEIYLENPRTDDENDGTVAHALDKLLMGY